MTKDELNERLALTYEPLSTGLLPKVRPDIWKAWGMDASGRWHPADFTSDYWFKRLIVEHKIAVEWREENDQRCWFAFGVATAPTQSGSVLKFLFWHDADPAIAVAECALKIREAQYG